jgi:uncharacterized membrane protein YhaH (DUF805 family)
VSLPRSRSTWAGVASQAFFAAFAVRRLRDARRSGDRLDLADALANVLVLATGTAVLVRQMRKDRS